MTTGNTVILFNIVILMWFLFEHFYCLFMVLYCCLLIFFFFRSFFCAKMFCEVGLSVGCFHILLPNMLIYFPMCVFFAILWFKTNIQSTNENHNNVFGKMLMYVWILPQTRNCYFFFFFFKSPTLATTLKYVDGSRRGGGCMWNTSTGKYVCFVWLLSYVKYYCIAVNE